MKTNTNKRLAKFEQVKAPLLKEWGSGEKWETLKKGVYFTFKHNIDEFLKYEAGTLKDDYKSERNMTNNELDNLFGLPYTSSGEFAALWNTNTQARAKYGALLYFRGVALSMDYKTVLIFDQPQKNAVEKTFYFYEYEFYNYQREEKQRNRAKMWGEFIKDANKLSLKAFEIIKKYNGKQYGEKTKTKIYEEIRAEAVKVGCNCWFDTREYWQGVEIRRNGFETFYNFNIINKQNTIDIKEAPDQKTEIDGEKIFDEACRIWQKMQKPAKELLNWRNEFEALTNKINKDIKATQSKYAIELDTIAGGRNWWEV